MGSNATYDIPVTVAGVNAPSVSLINDDAEGRTFIFASTVTSDQARIYGSADGVNFPPITATPLLTIGGNSPPITPPDGDRSLKYRAVFSGSGVRTLKLRAGTGCCAGGDSEHFNTLALPDFPAGGVIGTAAATVDIFAAYTFDQTTPGQTLTFPNPTDPSATYVRWVSNIGTASFVLYGLIVLPGAAGTKLIWNGSAWFNGCTGTASPTRTVLAAAGKNIIDSDGLATKLGNLDANVLNSGLDLFAGANGMRLTVDGLATMILDAPTIIVGNGSAIGGVAINAAGPGSIDLKPGQAGDVDLMPRAVGAGNTSKLRFRELVANGPNAISFRGPDAIAGDLDYVLWSADAAGAVSSNGSGTLLIVPPVKATFSAAASLVNAAAQFVPPSGDVTSLTLNNGTLQANIDTVSKASFRFTGDVANNLGQTVTMIMLKNGVPIAGASVSLRPTGAGLQGGDVTFAPVPIVVGDVLTMTFTPSALLTAVCTNVTGAIA